MIMEVEIKTLTPLWTGDVNRRCCPNFGGICLVPGSVFKLEKTKKLKSVHTEYGR